MPVAYTEQGFSKESIQGTWAFLATGTRSPDQPLALAGLLTFEEADRYLMTFTINAGGTSGDSISDICTFSVNADGTGSLRAESGPRGRKHARG